MKGLLLILAMLIGLDCFASLDTREKAFTIVCGKYKIKISARYKYTMRQISYDGRVVGTRSGYYGTVMALAKGKYIGAGHNEGGEERVLKMDFFADGKTVVPKTGDTLTVKSFLMRKTAMMDKLYFKTELLINQDGITEQKQFQATAGQPLYYIYIYLLCWNKSTTDWIAETANGKIIQGTFQRKNRDKYTWHLQQNVKWVANYNRVTGQGMMMYYPDPIKGKGRKSAFWEVKDRYNKYYLMLASPAAFPRGYKSPVYRLKLVGYSSSTAKLRETTEKLARDLYQNMPPVMKKIRTEEVLPLEKIEN
jgi:hypothetical protein